jgi:hypothetical protein
MMTSENKALSEDKVRFSARVHKNINILIGSCGIVCAYSRGEMVL